MRTAQSDVFKRITGAAAWLVSLIHIVKQRVVPPRSVPPITAVFVEVIKTALKVNCVLEVVVVLSAKVIAIVKSQIVPFVWGVAAPSVSPRKLELVLLKV